MQIQRKLPIRKCSGCGERFPKNELIRIVRTPEGEIILDLVGKKNGRGAYLCFSKECLKNAMKSKGLERSLKMPIPQNVYESLEKELDSIES